jgi:hypothetical protein
MRAALISVSFSFVLMTPAFAEESGDEQHSYSDAPRQKMDHPAVIIWRRAQEESARGAVPDASAADPLRLVRRRQF